ncbi:hypothetical protein PPTG_24257 [Phytophthora nicotianae INRA-310]|uniref:Uncharacterized protein n=1 Tax=Phytophthora nicotianae (strain INRA-310) TaxID=761204 RepID=W2PJY4_PHYN3|nr:hypothetical protein PPTG_24257 [Phytophthora nicotianae INRA-310]ETN00564.1 hypothetical protein PPTG_24257 [Phytophthora nicotianae INRA-310]
MRIGCPIKIVVRAVDVSNPAEDARVTQVTGNVLLLL